MFIATLYTFIGLAILVGLVFLQVWLSGLANPWLGLILPILSFLNSLLSLLNLMAPVSAGQIAGVLLACNIPTIIGLLIYFARRDKLRRKRDLDKMNIQDL